LSRVNVDPALVASRRGGHFRELDGLGASCEAAEEIAARTVNKQRARSGQSEQASKTSIEDISAPRRGGIRSGNRHGGGRTKAQPYADVKAADIKGRSKMTKEQLQRHLART
ncbi:MAG: hypothetical protein ACRDMV_16100, partial [Streptosporangiales bacterium]